MLTIMIPTMNRSDFLARLLHYYADTNYKHQICIGDSSDSSHWEEGRKVVKNLEGKLNITHLALPGVCIADCIKTMIDRTTTTYAVLLPDDDFLVPRSLEQCVDFLETHADYSAAHGKALMFTLKADGAHGQMGGVGFYRQRPIEDETAVDRLLNHLLLYTVTLFSVHRTDTWRNMYKDIEGSLDRAFMEEVIPCALSAVYGKIKQFDFLYLVRQGTNERRSLHRDAYDWIANPQWFGSYQVFHNSLTDAIVQIDGIDEKDACDVVKQALWLYMNRGLSNQFQEQYRDRLSAKAYIKVKLRDILQYIPGLGNLLISQYQSLKSRMYPNAYITLSGLLNHRSPYHADFMPIYDLVKKSERDVIAQPWNKKESP